jgi:hypothetical protein
MNCVSSCLSVCIMYCGYIASRPVCIMYCGFIVSRPVPAVIIHDESKYENMCVKKTATKCIRQLVISSEDEWQ